MVSQSEVEEAIRRLGGEGTTKQIYTELLKSGVMGSYYKNKNTVGSIVGATLSRLAKWGTIKKEFRRKSYNGRTMTGFITWVLVE